MGFWGEVKASMNWHKARALPALLSRPARSVGCVGSGDDSSAAAPVTPAAPPDCTHDGGDWPMFGQNVCNTASAAAPRRPITATTVSKLKVKWVFKAAARRVGDPRRRRRQVYFPDWGGKLKRLDAETGAVVDEERRRPPYRHRRPGSLAGSCRARHRLPPRASPPRPRASRRSSRQQRHLRDGLVAVERDHGRGRQGHCGRSNGSPRSTCTRRPSSRARRPSTATRSTWASRRAKRSRPGSWPTTRAAPSAAASSP